MLNVRIRLVKSFDFNQCVFLSLQNFTLFFDSCSGALQRFNGRSEFMVQDGTDRLALALILVQQSFLSQRLVSAVRVRTITTP